MPQLYREKCFDFNVRHFHAKLVEEHCIQLSYNLGRAAEGAPGGAPGYSGSARHMNSSPAYRIPGMGNA